MVHLTLSREGATWLQSVIDFARDATENQEVESSLDLAIADQRKSFRLAYIWADSDIEDDLSTIHENNGATFDDVMEALIYVTESLMVEAAGVEFDSMRTPLSPVLSDDDRRQLVFLNARMSLVHQIMNRRPSNSTVVG